MNTPYTNISNLSPIEVIESSQDELSIDEALLNNSSYRVIAPIEGRIVHPFEQALENIQAEITEKHDFLKDNITNLISSLQSQVAMNVYEADLKLDKKAKSLIDAILPEICKVDAKAKWLTEEMCGLHKELNWVQKLIRKWLGFA